MNLIPETWEVILDQCTCNDHDDRPRLFVSAAKYSENCHTKSTGISIGETRESSGYEPRSCDCGRYLTVRGAFFAPR